jgi:hypothetical protein
MSDGPSRAEFTAFCDRLYEQMDAGFNGVHERLDTLNGRTGKGEVADAELRARITSVEKEVFNEPRRRSGDTPAPPLFTKREGALVALGIGVVGALLKVLLLSGQFALEFVKAALKVKP